MASPSVQEAYKQGIRDVREPLTYLKYQIKLYFLYLLGAPHTRSFMMSDYGAGTPGECKDP